MVCYRDLEFQPDMLTAKRGDDTALRLKRQERALLRFVRQQQTLVTRAQLRETLGAESGSLSESSRGNGGPVTRPVRIVARPCQTDSAPHCFWVW